MLEIAWSCSRFFVLFILKNHGLQEQGLAVYTCFYFLFPKKHWTWTSRLFRSWMYHWCFLRLPSWNHKATGITRSAAFPLSCCSLETLELGLTNDVGIVVYITNDVDMNYIDCTSNTTAVWIYYISTKYSTMQYMQVYELLYVMQ